MAPPNDPRPPIRTCIGCRQRRPQADLVRCILGDDGVARADRAGAGRGAWLCGPDCCETAIRRGAFQRAWRRPVARDALVSLVGQLRRAPGPGVAVADDPAPIGRI